jgi:glycosyltransferase involved in cell wall biosynthesis
MVASPWFPIPPTGYGGIELVVSLLTEGLVRRGHRVTLFAAAGSRTSAKLVTTFAAAPSSDLGDVTVELRHVALAYQDWREFDLIHDHNVSGLPAASLLPVPVVHTIHGEITANLRSLYEAVSRIELVAISANQRDSLRPGRMATLIPNAVDTASIPLSELPGKYLLFVGRAHPNKGPLEAISIARAAGMPLRMLLKVNEPAEHHYFRDQIQPAAARGDVSIEFDVPLETKLAAYGGALATLFPIAWPEPFGLVMIESMACGTPVVAFRHGAAPEVIDHGVTGFLCDTVVEAVEHVRAAGALSRLACRERVERLFDANVNVRRHEELYYAALGGTTAEIMAQHG